MLPLVAFAFVLIALAVALEIVSYASLKRIPAVATEEFPEIDRELLGKFSSFDPELGWVPQPNQEKQKDTGDHLPGEELRTVVTYSTDEYGSRVCYAADRDEDADVTVSTYGDSYCFCREVNDDETFQHYMAQELDTHVANYGGGNYGLDQALLRMQRQYPEEETDYVFVVVTASSIARILSVWKHYQEFGNILAVKPRYVLENGELERIDSPVDEKEDLLDLESKADFLREYDFHYDHWFKPHFASVPYTSDFLDDPEYLRYAAITGCKELERRVGRSIPGVDFDAAQTESVLRMEQPRVRYHERLFETHEYLFDALIEEFVDYADEQDFQPVFVMVQQLRYAKYESEHGPIYGDLVDRLGEKYDALETVDMARHLDPDDGVESLYVERGEGGHYSPETNQEIAEVLTDIVEED
ncbi:conserved hypothetical protein [Haloterrigena turkmenica DSM 5511]|uniref:SGNH hydrolase-type esterase domain-containing protein n=1 Tax=Haloterrigena turkmenica (strain ATCC 51198 / DSM 5511 / JCM 9101 / NCIMB 13204 / VKM B-1734 / 4k) TaxID=543526 RepID=D2RUI7_HALTV|nr:hypothetical protein [Haloterrigena turkmenica]ADB61159.1 conserved hypothetical protein [Haloterrigena turkmenica DSM 5511]